MFTLITLIAVIAVALVLLGTLGLNSAYVPTPQDELLRMEVANTTKTASFNGTAFNLGTNFTPGGVGQASCAVVDVSALDKTTGDETYSAVLEESADGNTWTPAGASVSIGAVTVLSVPGFISQPNVRLHLTLGGTTPSITYQAWFNPLSP
ncbi:MAG: hypothetical protein ACTHLZ_18680 [Tepidisphaeraceae bacterium]